MINNLDGLFETPEYKENTHLCIHNNNICENYPPHWHSPLEVIMPTENDYTIIVDGSEYIIKPFELLFIGSGVIHSAIAPEHGQRYFFQIDMSHSRSITGISTILSFMGSVCHITPDNSPEIHRQLVRLFEEICDEYFSSGSDVLYSEEITGIVLAEPMIYAKFLTMLSLIGKNHFALIESDSLNQQKKKEYLEKIVGVCAYIDEHFAEEITLEGIADMVGYSKYHFARLFKQFTNASLYKYVNQKRIAHAEELLSQPNLSVTEIAIQCGFSTTPTFIRMFKQIKNCTPTDFRKLRSSYSFGNGGS